MADVKLVQSNFCHFFGAQVRISLKLGRKTVLEHSGVILYQSNQKGLLYKAGYSGRGWPPRFAKISNALFDPEKCSDMLNLLT